MASPGPPLPPEIAGQSSPEQAQSVFAQQGLDQPSPPQGMEVVQSLQQHIQKLEQWADQASTMLGSFDKSLLPLLQPIAAAGLDLRKALESKAKSSGMARGSPVVPPNAPMNPAAGPPTPAGG